MTKTKWWLISDEDIQEIRAALLAPTHKINDYNCEDWPPGTGCLGCNGDAQREEAVHTLDTGLYSTDAIPDDWLDQQENEADAYEAEQAAKWATFDMEANQ